MSAWTWHLERVVAGIALGFLVVGEAFQLSAPPLTSGSRTPFQCDRWTQNSTGQAFCKPNFLVIGCQRCGTSSLYHALIQHHQVRYTGRKENFFWKRSRPGVDRNKERCEGAKPEAYLRLFQDIPAPADGDNHVEAITGEFSSTYFECVCCPQAIKQVVPQAKMIVILREPMSRAESRWRESVRREVPVTKGTTWAEYRDKNMHLMDDCMNEAQESVEERARCASKDNIFGWSMYHAFLEHWAAAGYTPENLMISYLDDFSRDPLAELRKFELFLGLEKSVYDSSVYDVFIYDHEEQISKANKGPGPRNLALEDEGQRDLVRFYHRSLAKFRQLCIQYGWPEPPVSWDMKGAAPRRLARHLVS